ncbi:hypothetical protein HY229_06490 [Candidatus Acetothermia bacterium]|nr:hypothetical protein [Candidatus Acetothermia bacterium]MBI3643730.1 hypothetical protein [Candidatus Acetothermia bacterium]
MTQQNYRSDQEIYALVNEFETCQINPHHFNHHQHMTVAMGYLNDFSEEKTGQKIRQGLIRLLENHGAPEEKVRALYNETITLFWVKLLSHVLKSLDRQEPLYAKINWAIEHYGSMEPLFKHYSRDLVFSLQAKEKWMEPDLAPLPFSLAREKKMGITRREGG